MLSGPCLCWSKHRTGSLPLFYAAFSVHCAQPDAAWVCHEPWRLALSLTFLVHLSLDTREQFQGFLGALFEEAENMRLRSLIVISSLSLPDALLCAFPFLTLCSVWGRDRQRAAIPAFYYYHFLQMDWALHKMLTMTNHQPAT